MYFAKGDVEGDGIIVRRSRPTTAEHHVVTWEGVSGEVVGVGGEDSADRNKGEERMPGRRPSLKGDEVGRVSIV